MAQPPGYNGLPAFDAKPRSTAAPLGLPGLFADLGCTLHPVQYTPPVPDMTRPLKRRIPDPDDRKDVKRARPRAQSVCLHCLSEHHTWTQCSNKCHICRDHHPRSRCPRLALEMYLGEPHGFEVLERYGDIDHSAMIGPAPSDSISYIESPRMDDTKPERVYMTAFGPMTAVRPTINNAAPVTSFGRIENSLRSVINPDRAAMIATTRKLAKGHAISSVGPERTEANAIALGTVETTSTGAMKFSRWPQPGQRFTPAETNDVYSVLCQNIKLSVSAAMDEDSISNNGSDDAAVKERVREALKLLKPAFLRPKKSKRELEAERERKLRATIANLQG